MSTFGNDTNTFSREEVMILCKGENIISDAVDTNGERSTKNFLDPVLSPVFGMTILALYSVVTPAIGRRTFS